MKKTTEINIYLFGKPEWELQHCKCDTSAECLRLLGKSLHERLDRISVIVEKLSSIGMSETFGLYDIMYFTDDSEESVKEKLKELDIKEDEVSLNIIEDEDEEIIG